MSVETALDWNVPDTVKRPDVVIKVSGDVFIPRKTTSSHSVERRRVCEVKR